MPTLWPGGETCECSACGRFFSTTSNFDRHRVGGHDDNTRRCLTPDEMIAKGLFDRGGVWKQLPPERRVYGETALFSGSDENE